VAARAEGAVDVVAAVVRLGVDKEAVNVRFEAAGFFAEARAAGARFETAEAFESDAWRVEVGVEG
jgi:hypothetical protein